MNYELRISSELCVLSSKISFMNLSRMKGGFAASQQ